MFFLNSIFLLQALGNLYFIHESLEDVLIWDFNDSKFVPVLGEQIHSGNIEAVVTKEKAKFPQDFFPEVSFNHIIVFQFLIEVLEVIMMVFK